MAKSAFGDNIPVFNPVDLQGQLPECLLVYSFDVISNIIPLMWSVFLFYVVSIPLVFL